MTNKITRIFVLEDIRDEDKIILLEKHGVLTSLTSVAKSPRPPLWNTYATSKWIQEALVEAWGFDYTQDYVALTGNYLALAQLLCTLIAYSEQPYTVKCLAFSRANGIDEYCHVVLEECIN